MTNLSRDGTDGENSCAKKIYKFEKLMSPGILQGTVNEIAKPFSFYNITFWKVPSQISVLQLDSRA